jgi:hypothetical protein
VVGPFSSSVQLQQQQPSNIGLEFCPNCWGAITVIAPYDVLCASHASCCLSPFNSRLLIKLQTDVLGRSVGRLLHLRHSHLFLSSFFSDPQITLSLFCLHSSLLLLLLPSPLPVHSTVLAAAASSFLPRRRSDFPWTCFDASRHFPPPAAAAASALAVRLLLLLLLLLQGMDNRQRRRSRSEMGASKRASERGCSLFRSLVLRLLLLHDDTLY